MQPSRRTVLGVGGTAALTVLSGCSALTFTEDEPDPNMDVSDDVPFHVQLEGPETDERLFSGSDVTAVASIHEARTGGYRFQITVSEDAAGEIKEIFQSAEVAENPDEFEIVQYHGPEISRFSVAPSFADAVVDSEWNGTLQLHFADRNHALEVREHLTETSN